MDNRTYQREYKRRWREKFPERNRENFTRYNNGDAAKAARVRQRLANRYGITIGEYNQLLAIQGGVCAICQWPPKPGGRSLHVEHCHKTGRVRGLVCSFCNRGIGNVRDDPNIAEAIAVYLRKYE